MVAQRPQIIVHAAAANPIDTFAYMRFSQRTSQTESFRSSKNTEQTQKSILRRCIGGPSTLQIREGHVTPHRIRKSQHDNCRTHHWIWHQRVAGIGVEGKRWQSIFALFPIP